MPTYREQLEIVRAIPIREGENHTLDCPFCGGRRKFTLGLLDGELVWNCFRASCDARGRWRKGLPPEVLRKRIAGAPPQAPARRSEPLPAVTVRADRHEPSAEYLRSVHAWGAYTQGLVEVRYSPRHDRVLFYQGSHGAVGRSLSGKLPKWLAFGEVAAPFIVGSGKIAVIVEDVPSACAVTPEYCGVALLGTKVTPEVRSALVQFELNLIALDPDARLTALRALQGIISRVPARLLLLPSDPKAMDPKRLRETIDEIASDRRRRPRSG